MATNVLISHHVSVEREMMALSFESNEEFKIVAARPVDGTAVDAAVTHLPDVAIVVDQLIGREQAIDVAAKIKEQSPDTKIMFCTEDFAKDGRLNLAVTPASGWSYLVRSSINGLADMFRLVRGVASGLTIIDPSALGAYNSSTSIGNMTLRQIEVLGLVAKGLSNKAIAERLEMGERTVDYHLGGIYRHLGFDHDPEINARTAAVLEFLQSRLVANGAGRVPVGV